MKGSDGRKTRLVYVANARIPTERAHGVQIMQMCDAFARAGREVTLVVPDRKNPITATPWEYYGLEPRFTIVRVPIFDFIPYDRRLGNVALWLTTLWFVLKARGVVRRLKPDVVYSRDAAFAPFVPGGVPFVFEAHDFPTRPRWYRGLWSRCARIVAVTEGLKKAFVEAGVPPERLLTSHDGVDLDTFRVAATKQEARRELGLPADGFTAVYAGHLYPYKGTDDLLDACARLKPGSRVVFVGGRADALSLIKERAAKLGVMNAVFAGNVPHARVPLYLRAADAAVLPTRAADRHASEFLSPLKLFEYLAAGKAIVATDLPSAREVLDETVAVLVPPSDPVALAGALNDLADAPARRAALERKASALAAAHSWEARAARVLEGVPDPQPAPAWYRRWRTELALAGLAFLIRALYVALLPQARLVGGDGLVYLGLSDLVRGLSDEVPVGATYYPLLYPYFLAAVRILFGEDLVWIRLWQALFSAGTVFVMMSMARRWIGREAVVPTGLLGALYVPMILESGILYTETVYAFFLTSAVALAILTVERRHLAYALAAGCAFVGAGLTRELGFYQAAVFAAFAGIARRSWKIAAILIIPTLVALWGVGLRNAAIAEKFSLEAPPLVAKNYEAALAEPTLLRHLFAPDRWHLYPEGVFLYFRFPHRISDLGAGEPIGDPNSGGDVVLHLDVKRPFAPQPPYQVAAKILLTLYHWSLLALAAYGLWRGSMPRRVKAGLMIPVVFAFATIMFYGIKRLQGFESLEPLARYRFPSEPFILLLAVSGALALRRLKK